MLELVLASASPRRRALLEAAGVVVHLASAPCDEQRAGMEEPLAYARRVAEQKLHAARARFPTMESNVPWLAADTIVWADHHPDSPLFGKPRDIADAERMLRRLLGGPPHTVATAWALWTAGRVEVHLESTRVTMRALTPRELDVYLSTDEWRDKAGGYGIQGTAAGWVTRIDGSYTNVVGLPVAQVLQRLLDASPWSRTMNGVER